MLYAIGVFLLRIVNRLFFRITVVGRENIPSEKIGYMICSNHMTAYDPIFLAASLFDRNIHFLAKEELIKNPIAKWALLNIEIVPIKRGAADTGALDKCGEYIKNGEVVCIFPEGTRNRDGRQLKPKSGAAVIAGRIGAPILPVGIIIEGGKLKLFGKVKLVVGQMIENSELSIAEQNPREIKIASRMIMDRINQLTETTV